MIRIALRVMVDNNTLHETNKAPANQWSEFPFGMARPNFRGDMLVQGVFDFFHMFSISEHFLPKHFSPGGSGRFAS